MTSCSVAGPNPTAADSGAEAAQLRLLEGDGAADPLRLALATLGRELTSWSLVQVHHRPGAGATGIYQVQTTAEHGSVAAEFLCISTSTVPADTPATVQLTSPDGGPTLTVWQHPNDPLLPGLSWACDAAAVGTALFAGSLPALATVSYRPLRRAVLTADFAGERRYLKILRSGQGAHLAERHQLLINAGIPAPSLIEVPARDVLAMLPAAGTPLAELLMSDGARSLQPLTLVNMLRSLPTAALQLPDRPAWSVRVKDYARGAIAALPGEESRILALAATVHRLVTEVDAGPRVPAHGDFYEANLLVTGNAISGLLDVDALGPGHLVDDLACFIGHLAVLPAVDRRYSHIPEALQRFLAAFDQEVQPAALRGRAAGVALTLVAGAKHRATARDPISWKSDALQRLAIAESLADQALALQH